MIIETELINQPRGHKNRAHPTTDFKLRIVVGGLQVA
jgi:hypothetical protein